MASVFNLDEWLTDICRDFAKSAVKSFVEALQQLPDDASKYLAETPDTFLGGTVFTVIREISINAIVPIAIIILTMVICYDFISQFMNRSTRDMDLEVVFKLCFRLTIGIFLMNHVFDLTTGIFELGQTAVQKLITTVSGSPPIISGTLADFENKIDNTGAGECLLVMIFSGICLVVQYFCSIFVQVICLSRMLEIYIYCSISPIPVATLINREWGSVGTNFIKNLFALAFQAFMMEICLVLFNTLIAGAMASNESILDAILECLVVSVMLCFTMFKCGSISKSIFNAI